MKIIGFLLIIFGLEFTVFTFISFFTQQEVYKVGTVELTHIQPQYYDWLPFIGIIVIILGVYLLLQGRELE